MFEQLIAEAASRFNVSTTKAAALIRGLLGRMTNEQSGGLDGFLSMFRRAGLADTMASWLGGKQGKALTPSQVESALGGSTIDSLAASAGLSRAAVSAATAFMLPRLIGKLTPGGMIPSTSALHSQVSGFLARPASAAYSASARRSGWPPWLRWSVVAVLLAIGGWFALRGTQGTIDPQLTVSNRDGRITYSGFVRDEATRSQIVSALHSTFGEPNVSGSLRVDPNAKSASWQPRIGDVLAAVNTPGVDASLSGDAINLGGWLSAVQRQSLTDRLRGILGSEVTVGTLGDAAADAIRAANDQARSALGAIGTSGVSPTAVVQAMNLAIISFPTGSAQIAAEDMDIIRQSADALKRAPKGTTIEIAGHTDDTGDAQNNLRLSQQRADAVRNALTSAGVSAEMLTTKGYGSTRPRAQNDTEYGRFQNRRIEYSVVK